MVNLFAFGASSSVWLTVPAVVNIGLLLFALPVLLRVYFLNKNDYFWYGFILLGALLGAGLLSIAFTLHSTTSYIAGLAILPLLILLVALRYSYEHFTFGKMEKSLVQAALYLVYVNTAILLVAGIVAGLSS